MEMPSHARTLWRPWDPTTAYNNLLDIALLQAPATAFETLDNEAEAVAIVLASLASTLRSAHFHYPADRPKADVEYGGGEPLSSTRRVSTSAANPSWALFRVPPSATALGWR
jgi:hypothetical protein